VADVRAFALLLRTHIALDHGETDRARALCDETRAAIGQGTPPPQFVAFLAVLEANLTAAESGPEHGLPMLADTLSQAMADQCAEAVTSAIVDSAALLLVEIGDVTRAARLLAVADGLRGPHPRPAPQRSWAERAEAAARAALGAERYAAERARVPRLTVADALHELTEAVRAHPAPLRPRAATSR
jgi:hypothetical protein